MMEHSSTALLFLAAGASRRMGSPKALLPWHDGPVIHHHFNLFQSVAGIDPWIVMHPDDQALTTELNTIGWPKNHRAVNPAAPDCEMIESIICGIRAILEHSADYRTIGIALIDQLLIQPGTFQALENEADRKPDSILQPAYHEKRGHPVLLPRSLAEELADYHGASLRHFMESHADFCETLAVDDQGILKDMDTPKDYQEQYSTH